MHCRAIFPRGLEAADERAPGHVQPRDAVEGRKRRSPGAVLDGNIPDLMGVIFVLQLEQSPLAWRTLPACLPASVVLVVVACCCCAQAARSLLLLSVTCLEALMTLSAIVF